MKILCVCQRGNVRSVAMAFLLKDIMGYNDTLSCGIETASPETFAMLANWADKIFVVAHQEVIRKVPKKWRKKTVAIDIGEDQWGSSMHTGLLKLLHDIIIKEKLVEVNY